MESRDFAAKRSRTFTITVKVPGDFPWAEQRPEQFSIAADGMEVIAHPDSPAKSVGTFIAVVK